MAPSLNAFIFSARPLTPSLRTVSHTSLYLIDSLTAYHQEDVSTLKMALLSSSQYVSVYVQEFAAGRDGLSWS
jgi:hypothetical protein